MKGKRFLSILLTSCMLFTGLMPGMTAGAQQAGQQTQEQADARTAADMTQLEDGPTPVLQVSFDEENANDASGNGNHGTVVGNPEYTEGVKGKAIHLVNPGDRNETADQYVNFGQPEELKFGTGSFSIMFWFKADDISGAELEGSIVSNKNWETGDNPGFNIGHMDQGVNLNFNTDGDGKGRAETDRFSGAVDGKWHHVAAVVDREDQKQIALYIDGKEAFGGSGEFGSRASTVDISDYHAAVDVLDFVLGADGEKRFGVENAFIDEMSVYKEALTQEFISQTFEDEKQPEEPEVDPTPVLQVSFDEENANDASGNENHGTVVGNPEYAEGVSGKAIHLVNPGDRNETADQYVSFGQPEDLQFGTGSFSIMFWFKADDITGGELEGSIVSNKNWDTGDNPGFNIGHMDQGVNLNFNTNGDGRGRAETDRFSGAVDGSWHHVAAVIDREDQKQIALYIDGREAYGGSGSFGSRSSTVDISGYNATVDVYDFVLGADGQKRFGVENAYIDELLVYKEAVSREFIYQSIAEEVIPMELDRLEEEIAQIEPGGRYPEDWIADMQEKVAEAREQIADAEANEQIEIMEKLQESYEVFLEGSEPNTVFHMISDTHVRTTTEANGQNLAAGLEDMKRINPDASALITVGDNSRDGLESEVEAFYQVLEEHYPLDEDGKTLIALGNHDVRGPSQYWEDFPVGENAYWSTSYGLYMKHNAKYMPDTDGKTYYDYWADGYHLIVLNPENAPKDTAYLTDTQLAWLKEKLSEQEDPMKPAIVIVHQALNETHWGSHMYNGFGPQDDEVKEILQRHPQTIVVSGHIHNGFGVNEVIDRPYGTLVDVPAFEGSERGVSAAGTGYEVYVYDDEILFRARNFVTSTWMPEYDLSVKLKSLPVLVSAAKKLNKQDYTKESWDAVEERLETALTQADAVMNKKYGEDYPDTWLYHADTRAEIENLRKEFEDIFDALAEVEDQDRLAAEAVMEAINEIGEVSLASKEAIEQARAAYEALTDTQKQMVENLKTLEDAEAVYAKLAEEEAAYQKDKQAADAVQNQIHAIGVVTLEKGEQIQKAREAYEALTETQKAMVDNLQSLVNAELHYQLLLQEQIDTAVLKAAIEAAEKLDAEKYTEASFAKVRDALEAAKQTNLESQEEINQAVAELLEAICQLEEKTPQKPQREEADLKELQEKILLAEQIDWTKYTAASVRTLDYVLASAKELVLSNPAKELQSLVNGMSDSLQKAIDGLQTLPESPSIPEDSSTTPNTDANGQNQGTQDQEKQPELKKGEVYKVGKLYYKVLSGGKVAVWKPAKKSYTSITVPATVKINGITCKVTEISKNAFKGNKKLRRVTIGSNVEKIGKKAFFGDRNLKKIVIKSKKLKKAYPGSIKGISSKAVIRVPKGKVKAYKKLFSIKGNKIAVKAK